MVKFSIVIKNLTFHSTGENIHYLKLLKNMRFNQVYLDLQWYPGSSKLSEIQKGIPQDVVVIMSAIKIKVTAHSVQ